MKAPPSIYLVEDDTIIVRQLHERLKRLGYQIAGTAARGEDALAELARITPDVVLMDINLAGELDGVETATRLQASGEAAVVLLTGSTDPGVLGRADAVANIDCLLKPFEEHELHAAIQMALYRRKLEHRLHETRSPIPDAARERATRLKEARNQLTVGDARLRDFFDHCTDLIQIVGVDGGLLFANRAWLGTLGFSQAETATINVFDLIAPECREHCRHEFQRLIAGENVGLMEVVFLTRDGRRIEAEGSVNMRFEDGRPVSTRGIFRDVTERRRAAARLRDTEQRFQRAIEATQLGCWDWKVATGEIVFNTFWAAMLGYQPGELTPTYDTWHGLVHPDDWAGVLATLNAHLAGHSAEFAAEYRMRARDGRWHWVRTEGRVMSRDGDGRAALVSGTHQDIHHRKLAELARRESEENLAITLRCIGDAVLVTDSQRRVTRMNPVAERLTGWTEAEARNRPVEEVFRIVHEQTREPAVLPEDQVIATGTIQGLDDHTLLLARDGRETAIADSAAPLRDAEGGILGMVLVFRDVTAERRAAQLEHRQREQSDRFQAALLALRNHEGDEARAFFHEATVQVAEALQIARASVWLFDATHSTLTCEDLYERASRTHSAGAQLTAAAHPAYFQAVSSHEAIVAGDASTHPAMRDLTASIHAPLGLTSLLDVPIRVGGQLSGMLCCGHAGPARPWTPEEIKFTVAAANGIMLAMEQQERRKAEAALLREGQRLASVIEGTNTGTWEWNVQTGESVFNERWASIAGYTLAELAPVSVKTWLSLAHPGDLQASQTLLERHFAGELPYYDFECRMRHKAGHWVWIQNHSRLVSRTPDGRPLLMIGTHIDITARKAAEAELRAVHQRLELALRASRTSTWDCDLASGKIALDPAWTELLGQPSQPTVTTLKSLLALTHPSDRPGILTEIHQSLYSAKDEYQTEHRVADTHGRWVWILSKGRVVERDSLGRAIRIIGTNTDITARKIAEEALRERHAMQQVVSAAATSLLAAPAERMDAAITAALQASGTQLRADRGYLFLLSDDGTGMSNTHEWCAPGIEPQRNALQNIPLTATPWWLEQLTRVGLVMIPDVAALPPEAAAEKALLESQQIRSLFSIAMQRNGRICGFIGYDAVRRQRDWAEADIGLLQVMGEVIGSALARQRAEASMRILVESTAAATGDRLFQAAVRGLAQSMGVRAGFIARRDTAAPSRIRTLAIWNAGRLGENFSYELAHTPCENVLKEGLCVHASDVAARYPGDLWLRENGIESYVGIALHDSAGRFLGHMGVMDGQPLAHPEEVVIFLKLFATRIAGEMERQQSEHALREAQAKYERLLDDMGDQFVVYSHAGADGVLNYVSNGVTPVLGLTKEAALARTWSNLVDWLPEDLGPAGAQLPLRLEPKAQLRDFDLRFNHPDGSQRTVRVSRRGVWDGVGQLIGIDGVMQDVTARRRAEEEVRILTGNLEQLVIQRTAELAASNASLRKTEARFRGVFERSPIIIALLTVPGGRIVEINPAAVAAFGYSYGEAVGRSAEELGIWADPADRDRYLEELRTKRQVRSFASRMRRRNGEIFPVLFSGCLIEIDGQTYSLNSIQDITAQRESEARFRHVFENSPIGIYRTTPDGRVLLANPALLAMLGFASLDELTRRTLEDPDRFIDQPRAVFKERIDREGEIRGLENAWRRADGSVVYVRENARGVRDHAGRILFYEGTVEDITAWRQAETALRESEARFRGVFDASPIPILLTSVPEGRIVEANTASLATFGYARDEALGRTVAELRLWPQSGQRDEFVRRIREETAVQAFEAVMRTHAGEERYMLCNGTLLTIGNRQYTLASALDITERKLTAEALDFLSNPLGGVTSETYYQNVAERIAELLSVEHGFVATLPPDDPDHYHAYGSWRSEAGTPRVMELLREFQGKPCAALRDQEHVFIPDRAAQLHPDDSLLRDRGIAGYAAVRLHNAAGQPIGFLGIMSRRPLRNPRRVEMLLQLFAVRVAGEMVRRQSESKFHDLFEFSPDAVLILNTRMEITDANRRATGLFGCPREELIGSRVDALVPPMAQPALLGRLAAFFINPVPHAMGAAQPGLFAQDKTGRVFPLDIGLSPLQTPQGQHVVATLRDITREVEARELREKTDRQLREAQKMESLGELAGGIAHDFNNILTGVINYTALAREDCPPELAQIREYLGEVLTCGNRAKDLVRQILLFSRAEEGRQEPLRLQSVFMETLTLLRATLPSSAVIESNLDPGAPDVRANATQLHQVLLNLGVNAAHALKGRPGRITIRLDHRQLGAAEVLALPGLKPGPHVRLEVTDTGCGMDEAVRARIFEPFFSTKPTGEGTGLGLAVVQSVVRSHRGAITVRSEPGAGTTFELFFPASPRSTLAPAQKFGTLPRGHGQHILLVDDESTIIRSTELLLARLGYRTTRCTRPEEALLLVRTSPEDFDAMITDFQMPGMTGLMLAEKVLAHNPDLPVLLASGFAGGLTAEGLEEQGITDLLHKPLEMEELAHKLARVFAAGPDINAPQA